MRRLARARRPASALLAGLLALLAVRRAAGGGPALPQRLPGRPSSSQAWNSRRRSASRPTADGLRRREGRQDPRLRSLEDETPELFADLRTEVYDNGDRGLLGLALDPDIPDQALRLRALHLRPRPRRSGAARRNGATPNQTGDACPEPTDGADDCLVSGRLVRLRPKLTEAAAIARRSPVRESRWSKTGASSSPRTRSATCSSAPKARSTPAAATAPASPTPTTGSSGDAAEPLRRPARSEGGVAALARTCRTRPALARPDRPQRHDHPHRPRNRRRLAGNPMRQPRRERAPDRRLRLPQPLPLHDRPRRPTRSTSATSAGSQFEEIDRFDPSAGSLYNSGWPCYEGAGREYQFKDLGLTSAKASTRNRSRARASPPFFYYSHTPDGGARRRMPDCTSGSAISGLAFYEGDDSRPNTKARSSSPTRCAAAST